MDANDNDPSNMELLAEMEKLFKEAKMLAEKSIQLALQIKAAEESPNLYVSDSDVEDNVHGSCTPSIRRGPKKVKENLIVNDKDVKEEGVNEMMKILLPKFFEQLLRHKTQLL